MEVEMNLMTFYSFSPLIVLPRFGIVPPVIDFLDVSIAFGFQTILDKVSFRVNAGERVGIVGPNGAGKSTIFSLLAHELQQDSGEINVPRNLSMGYLRQQLRPHTVDCSLLAYAENAMFTVQDIHKEIDSIEAVLSASTGLDREQKLERLGTLQTELEHRGGYELATRAKTILGGLGFSIEDLDKPFRLFSGGWQMRAELARALASHPDLFLLDEPTNFLDIPAVEWLRNFLKEYPGTLLLISHDRYLLNSLTDVTLEVFNGHVTRYPGNYDHFVRVRAERQEHLLGAKKNQDRKIAQAERFIERFRAKSTKAALVQSQIKKLKKMEEIVVPSIDVRPPKIRLPEPPHCGHEIARFDDAGISYDDGATWVLRHVDLRIEQGEKTALVGLNGLGKSTLLRALAGRLPLKEGRRVCGHRVIVGYQAQDLTETMDPEKTIFEAARSSTMGMKEVEIRSVLGSFLFPGDSIEKQIQVLSGGEKMRLAIACMLLKAPNFLLLDEPTTHLDIPSREALEDALVSYEGTLLLVSHDIEFVRKVATRIIAMVPQNIRRYAGGYDYYHEKIQAEWNAATVVVSKNKEATPSINSRKALRQERALQRQELYKLTKDLKKKIAHQEKNIETLENQQHILAAALQDTANAKIGLDFESLGKRLKLVQHEIDEATRQWEKDSTELESILKQPEDQQE